MITKDDFLKCSDESEVFCLIAEFLHRARDKDLLSEKNLIETKRDKKLIGKTLILTDKEVIGIIKEMKETESLKVIKNKNSSLEDLKKANISFYKKVCKGV